MRELNNLFHVKHLKQYLDVISDLLRAAVFNLLCHHGNFSMCQTLQEELSWPSPPRIHIYFYVSVVRSGPTPRLVIQGTPKSSSWPGQLEG